MNSPSQSPSTLPPHTPSSAVTPLPPSPSISPLPTTSSSTATSSPSPPLSPRPSIEDQHPNIIPCDIDDNKGRKKSNSSSFLSRLSKWFEEKKKKKKVLNIKHLFRLFFSKGEERGKRDLRRRPYSFSGNSNPKERDKWMRRRGEFSAPASMRTSPTNSGLLLATPAGYSSSNDSSMEELQGAIQAAIAHCKNSTAAKERKAI